MLLEVHDINTYRGPAHILRGVSINVDTDEVVALVGRNGAGRTTIIESITGLLPVRSGEIRFRDEAITSLPPHRRQARHRLRAGKFRHLPGAYRRREPDDQPLALSQNRARRGAQ